MAYSAFFNASSDRDGIDVGEGDGVGPWVGVTAGSAVGDGKGVGVGDAPHAIVMVASTSSAQSTRFFFTGKLLSPK